jgi:hypothetical protein
MAIAKGLNLVDAKEPTNPFGVFRFPPTKTLAVGDKFLMGKAGAGTLVYNSKNYPLQELRLYTVEEDSVTSRPLVPGESFTVLGSDGVYDGYVATATNLLRTTGIPIIRVVLTPTVPTAATMVENTNYFVTFASNARNTIYRKTKVGVSSEEIAAGTIIIHDPTKQVYFFDGEFLREQFFPYLVLHVINENIELYNPDGSKRNIPYRELIDKYPVEGGFKPGFPNESINHTVLLRAQTDKTQNWPYTFRNASAQGDFTWQKDTPFLNGTILINSLYTIRIIRGDGYTGAEYRLEAVDPFVQPGTGRRLIRLNQPNPALNTKVEWVRQDVRLSAFEPVKKDLDSLIEDKPFFVKLSDNYAGLKNINYVSLDVQKSFSVSLPSTLKFAQFYCSSANSKWDEKDLPKLQGKTSAEALAANLDSKIVLIGDSTDTFEMFGAKSSGPFVFRNNNRMVQITKSGNVFEVSDMLLQVLDTSVQSTLGRTIYTTSTALTPESGDLILVDGVGNINLPADPVDGFKFTLDDRKLKRLNLNRNRIVPAAGQTIGLGQGDATADYQTPLTWDTEDAGSFSNYFYEAASKNWVVLLTREVQGTAITQSAQKPLIYTTNIDAIAQPYDRLYLNGTGNILLTQIVAERQFIDIEWSVGATWIIKVICPVGFTIAGVFEDLDINTALTSVTHLRLALKAGNDFGVSA